MDTYTEDTYSTGQLLRELKDEARLLFRQEVALARTEMAEKISVAGRNAAYLGAGAFITLLGAIFVLAAISALASVGLINAGLSQGTAAWLGPAIVGLSVCIAGYAMIQKALRKFKSGSLKPERTLQSLKEDKAWTQHKIRRS